MSRSAAAARRGTSIVALIDESLEAYGIKSRATAAQLVAGARSRAAMDEATAVALAVDEVRRTRG